MFSLLDMTNAATDDAIPQLIKRDSVNTVPVHLVSSALVYDLPNGRVASKTDEIPLALQRRARVTVDIYRRIR